MTALDVLLLVAGILVLQLLVWLKGNAVADRRLMCRMLLGRGFAVPLDEIAEVREDRWFLRAYRGGRIHVILKRRAASRSGSCRPSTPGGWRR